MFYYFIFFLISRVTIFVCVCFFFTSDEGILIPKARVLIQFLDLRVVFNPSTSSYLCPTPAPIFMESYLFYILTQESNGPRRVCRIQYWTLLTSHSASACRSCSSLYCFCLSSNSRNRLLYASNCSRKIASSNWKKIGMGRW